MAIAMDASAAAHADLHVVLEVGEADLLYVRVERAGHLQHGRLVEAPRAREQHNARFRVD